jgi:hypothetical protein
MRERTIRGVGVGFFGSFALESALEDDAGTALFTIAITILSLFVCTHDTIALVRLLGVGHRSTDFLPPSFPWVPSSPCREATLDRQRRVHRHPTCPLRRRCKRPLCPPTSTECKRPTVLSLAQLDLFVRALLVTDWRPARMATGYEE